MESFTYLRIKNTKTLMGKRRQYRNYKKGYENFTNYLAICSGNWNSQTNEIIIL
jgi:hypothetical protein